MYPIPTLMNWTIKCPLGYLECSISTYKMLPCSTWGAPVMTFSCMHDLKTFQHSLQVTCIIKPIIELTSLLLQWSPFQRCLAPQPNQSQCSDILQQQRCCADPCLYQWLLMHLMSPKTCIGTYQSIFAPINDGYEFPTTSHAHY